MGSSNFTHIENNYPNFSKNESFLKRLTVLVEKNLEKEQFGVEDLASAMNMNRTQLYRRIKSLTGKTASQYIREIRLLEAMELHKNDVATASEIAYKVGFRSPTYFNKCFHDYFGYPPGDVKKKIATSHGLNKSAEEYNHMVEGKIEEPAPSPT